MAAPVEFIAPKATEEQTRHEHAKGKRGDGSIGANTIIVYALYSRISDVETQKTSDEWYTGTLCIYEAAEYECRNVSADWSASRRAVVLGMRRTVGTEPDDVDLGM